MRRSISSLATASVIAAGVLLRANPFAGTEMHRWISALPLLLAGAAFAMLQARLRPPRATILQRLLLASAFVGWVPINFFLRVAPRCFRVMPVSQLTCSTPSG